MAKDKKTEDEILEAQVEEKPDEEIVVEAETGNPEGVEDWKAQLEAAQKRAEEAEAKRAEMERLAQERADEIARVRKESETAHQGMASAEMRAVENAIANTDLEKADLTAKLKTAYEQGDFDAVAQAQADLSANAVKAQRLREGKANIERRLSDAAAREADPVERYVANLTPQSAAWIRAHPTVINDMAKLERAHYKALGEGIRPETPEYFAHMDREMGFAQPDPSVEQRTETREQRQPNFTAPPSRNGSQPPPVSPNSIRLSPEEREIAKACGLSDAEYAKHKLAIQREGQTTH